MEQYQKVLVEFEKLFGVLTGETEETDNIDDFKKMYLDGINVNGEKKKPYFKQLHIGYSLIENHGKDFIFNVGRQIGFTTMMMNYALLNAMNGKVVAYVTCTTNGREHVKRMIDGMNTDLHATGCDKNGNYYFNGARGGAIIIMAINPHLSFPEYTDICIFDNADFYHTYVLEYYTNELSKKGIQIIIGSCPNTSTSIFESYYKRLWLENDNGFEKVEIPGNFLLETKNLIGQRCYDFEYNNAREYFSEARKLFEKIKEL